MSNENITKEVVKNKIIDKIYYLLCTLNEENYIGNQKIYSSIINELGNTYKNLAENYSISSKR